MDKGYVINRLSVLGINPSLIDRYDEPHRFYHNWNHIHEMLNCAVASNIMSDELLVAIVFHDIVYNPMMFNNEEESALLFLNSGYTGDQKSRGRIKNAILDTKSHKPDGTLSVQLCMLDLQILNSNLSELIKFENKIFKEYQFVDYKKYKDARIKVLRSLQKDDELEQLIHYVEMRMPNIGLYPGSFNPFHVGHMEVLKKAEAIFDKVIIARGRNEDKNDERMPLPESIMYRQVETYDGYLTDFIDELGYDVTVIRGLRNSTDLQYEMTQYRYMQDMKPDIKIVSIFCDHDYEHVSSSAIKKLMKSGKPEKYEKYMVQ